MKKYEKHTDLELVRIVTNQKKPDSAFAFKEIFRRYAGGINAYCLKVIGDKNGADDVFQEVFLKFYQTVDYDKFIQSNNINNFLITIARNLCLNYKRNQHRNRFQDVELDLLPAKDTNQDNKELLDLINYALDLIDNSHRSAFVLREYVGLDYDEIAVQEGISVGNAKLRVFRAKQKIKEILQPYLKDLKNH